jgi:hypothetical protein
MGFVQSEFDQLAATHKRAWVIYYKNPMSRRDEFAAIGGILSRPHRVIFRKANDYAEVSVVLVNLGENNDHPASVNRTAAN